jgi:hypothetical protein
MGDRTAEATQFLNPTGYRRFAELHNERQLLGLHLLAERIRAQPDELRPALATVYSDFLRYQNLICRYDTAALKVLDVVFDSRLPRPPSAV